MIYSQLRTVKIKIIIKMMNYTSLALNIEVILADVAQKKDKTIVKKKVFNIVCFLPS